MAGCAQDALRPGHHQDFRAPWTGCAQSSMRNKGPKRAFRPAAGVRACQRGGADCRSGHRLCCSALVSWVSIMVWVMLAAAR